MQADKFCNASFTSAQITVLPPSMLKDGCLGLWSVPSRSMLTSFTSKSILGREADRRGIGVSSLVVIKTTYDSAQERDLIILQNTS